MALFGKKTDASSGASTGSGTTTAPPAAKGSKGKGGLFGKKGAAAPSAPATPTAPASDAGQSFDDFSDFGNFGAPAPEIARAPVATTRARPKVVGGTAIGLNIGNATIKAVELRASGGSVKITGAAMVPTPAESLSNGVIVSQAALAQGIKDAIQAAGIKSKAVTTAVSGTGSIVVRVVEIPRMSDKELEETMRTDAEKYIPFSPDEVRLDFRPLRELPAPPDSPNIDVLIAAAQREVLYQYGDTIKAARLAPRAIEVEPLAVARALSHAVEGSEVNYARVSAVVNIGATATEISVLRGDILVFTRTLPSGGHALTQALVDYLGLNESDAERYKRDLADALPSFQQGMAPANTGGGFDDFGGDDWSNLDFDTPSTYSTPTSLQKDAPEQHGQKADDTGKEDEKPAFDFSSFDFADPSDDKPAAPAESPKQPTQEIAPDASAPSSFNFDFDAPEAPAAEAAPAASTYQAPAAETPAAAPDPFNFSFDSVEEPAPVEPVAVEPTPIAPATVPSTPATPAADSTPFDFDFTAAEAASPSAAPTLASETSMAPSTGPVETDVSADPSMTIVPADETSAWGLDEAEASPAATSGNVSLSKAPDAAAADAFDLDALFSTPDAAAAGAGAAAVGAGAFAASASSDDDPFGTMDFGADDFGGAQSNDAAPGVDAPTVYSILHPLMDELAGEIRRSLEYHASRYPEAVVQSIELVGGGAKLRNLDAFLTQSLGIPTSVADPLHNIGGQVSPEVRGDGPAYAVAIGLALRELLA